MRVYKGGTKGDVITDISSIRQAIKLVAFSKERVGKSGFTSIIGDDIRENSPVARHLSLFKPGHDSVKTNFTEGHRSQGCEELIANGD